MISGFFLRKAMIWFAKTSWSIINVSPLNFLYLDPQSTDRKKIVVLPDIDTDDLKPSVR